ncbi:hypothetical protein T05_14961 [Trichinella murrelli]|uniref:Uncharacterized protein n=1 Tax=Trichinella murrelli TaxID=144512 RepID=A0A0V0TE81_9BILA|nr:hypothetical protein T05_14961 [Trichinella murrelli]
MDFESMMVEDGTFGQEKKEEKFENEAVFNNQAKYFSNTDHLSNSSEQTESIDEQEAEEERGQELDESEHEEKEKDEDAVIVEEFETEKEEEEEEEENANNNNNAEDEEETVVVENVEVEKEEEDDDEEKEEAEEEVEIKEAIVGEDAEIEEEKNEEKEKELLNMEYNDDQVDQDQLINEETATHPADDEAVDASESKQMHEEENDEDMVNKNKHDKSINSLEEWVASKEQVETDANANSEIQKSTTENETTTIIIPEADAKDDSISVEQNMEKEEIGDSTGEELDDQSEFSDEETEAQNEADYATLDAEKNEAPNDIPLQKNSTCENVKLKQSNEEPPENHQLKDLMMDNTEEIQEIDHDDTEQSIVEKTMDENDETVEDEISTKVETEKHIDQPIYLDISTGYTYATTAEEEQTEAVENSDIISVPEILSEQCPEIVETQLFDKEEEVEQVKEDQDENHIVTEDVERFTDANSSELQNADKVKEAILETAPLNGEILPEEIVKDDQIKDLTENEEKDNFLKREEESINESSDAKIEIIEEKQVQPAEIEMKTSDISELNNNVELSKEEETEILINNEEINETILHKVEVKEGITEKVNEVGEIIDQGKQDAEQVKQESGALADSSEIVNPPDNAKDQMNEEEKEANTENVSDRKISEIPIQFIEIKQTDDSAENMNEIAVEIFEQNPDDAKDDTVEKQSELKQKDEVDTVKESAEDLNNNDISEKNNNYLLKSEMENEMKESSEKIGIDEEIEKSMIQQIENKINKSSLNEPAKVEMNKQENMNEIAAQKFDTSEQWKMIDAEVEEIKKRRNRQTHESKEIRDSYPFLPSRSSASLSLSSSYHGDLHSRPMNHYVSIFDNQVNTGPFSQSSYGSLTRSRSRSRERLGYSNMYRTSSFSKLSSYHDFDNIRWTKPSTQIPLRSTSFTAFMDYYDKVKDNLHRTYSNQKLYERKTYTPRWTRSESRNNFWNYYDQMKRDLRRTYVKPSLYESKLSYSIFPIRSRSFDRLSSYYRRMKTEFRNANAYFKSSYTRPFSRIRSFYRPWKFDTYLF